MSLSLTGFAAPAPATQPAPLAEPWTLNDQFDRPYRLDANTRVLLVARSMGSAKLVNATLEDQAKGYLEARDAVFIADIERMPAVAKLFFLPAMRDASYRILLDREGQVAARYGSERDAVIWVEVRNGEALQQRLFSDATSLKSALDALAP
ncbi:FAD/FMN-containing dehydrogenase [Pseudomonas borbori]